MSKLKYCKCCQALFEAKGKGRPPKYCPSCQAKGPTMRLCVVCEAPFMRSGIDVKTCERHRGTIYKGPTAYLEYASEACRTCGGPIPSFREDEYCQWRHNPQLLTKAERKMLRLQFSERSVG